MTTFIIITVTVLFLIALSLLGNFIRKIWKKRKQKNKKTGKNKESINGLNWQSMFALVIALAFLGLSFIAPFLFTRNSINSDFDFNKTGAIGDTIGGLMNPFIAMAGVIVTGLAFYMQFRANLLQREIFNEQLIKDKERFDAEIQTSKDQFQSQLDSQAKQNDLQQFEAQFYEMLRLHKENVNEIEVPAKREIKNDNNVSHEPYLVTKRNAFVEFKKEFEAILREVKKSDLEKIDKESFKIAYSLFFWGLNKEYNNEEQRSLAELFNDDNTLENRLHKLKNNQYNTHEPFETDMDFTIIAFEGHSGFLGHYYRHLFLILKFVVSQREEFLSYGAKMKYLKILRAQLSNHEQIMLFYNWLGDYGRDWENKKNQFFTEYCMIHNLWYNIISKDDFVVEKINELKNKPVTKRQGKMFELQS